MNRTARIAIAFSLLVIAVTVGILFLVKPSTSTPAAPSGIVKVDEVSTVDLTGTWKSDGMTATVTDSTIEIMWSTDDLSGLYWKGTFTATVQDGAKIFSAGDADAMSDALMASQDAEKEFTYQNGELSFKLTMMKVVQIIRMTRGS